MYLVFFLFMSSVQYLDLCSDRNRVDQEKIH